MFALVLNSVASLKFESEWPFPQADKGWVIVKVCASGICGSDLSRIMKTGAYRHPMIPGHEFSGIVETEDSHIAKGTKVGVLPIIPCGKCDGCRIGPFHCRQYDFLGSRRDGGFAQYCAVPSQNLVPLPENISLEEGAFLEPLSVALHAVQRSMLHRGDKALVLGCGAIGLLIAQWARIFGAQEVFLADIRSRSLEIARACGFEHAFNPSEENMENIGEFDAIFEAAGSNTALVSAVEKIKPSGSIIMVGRDVKDTLLPVAVVEKFMRKEVTLIGCWGYDNRDQTQFLYENLKSGKFIFHPMITHRIALADGPAVIEKMWQREIFFCKVMFCF